MANIKISELTSETELSENHIVITEQKNATETKKSTLGLLLNWIVNKLPIATADKVGSIKSGGDITVSTDGAVTVNSVNGKTVKTDVPEDAVFTDTVYKLPVASDTVLGGVKVDGNTITVGEDGAIHFNSKNYTSVLTAEEWVGEAAPYTQTINIDNITSETSPIIDLVVSDDVDTGKEEVSQWANITKATAGENSITFSCYDTKPTIILNIKVKVV